MTTEVGTANVIIQCHIINFQGNILWSKDGFIFTPSNSLPFPRFSLQTGRTPGEQNLRITDIKPEDDGEYFCQAWTKHQKLRSRNAYLNVNVPPQNLEISPSKSNVISVQADRSISVACRASDARPAPSVSWNVGNDNVDAVNEEIVSPETKLVTTTSTIRITPTKADNGTIVRCFAENEATRRPMLTEATLNVLYPPQQPVLDAHASDPMLAGQEAIITCTSVGGNPLPSLMWTIGGETINRELTYSRERVTTQLRHRLRPQDHNKIVSCIASSPALLSPLTTSVTLNVHYAPKSIEVIQNPTEGAAENTTLTLSCTATKSNPASVLTWLKNDLPIAANEDGTIISTVSFGFSTRTSLTLTSVKREHANDLYACKASVPELGFIKKTKVTLKILYPPTSIQMTIHHPKAVGNSLPKLEAGQTAQLLCKSKGGYPASTLTWSKNGSPVQYGSAARILPGTSACANTDSTCSILEIVLQDSDNLAEYQCRAVHVASNIPKQSSVILQVLYMPQTITVQQSPVAPATGEAVSFVCESSSSNPASAISWYRDGSHISHLKVETLTTRDGVNGGMISNSRMRFISDSSFHGSRITCRAENPALKKSIEKEVSLNIEFPPMFEKKKVNFAATDGELDIVLYVPATANPSNVTYQWSRLMPLQRSQENDQRILAPTVGYSDKKFLSNMREVQMTSGGRVTWSPHTGVLRIQKIELSDSGLYKLSASNRRGRSTIDVSLAVYYSPRIVDLSGPERTFIGDDVIMTCTIDSLPATTNVQWIKNIPNAERIVYDVTTVPGRSILSLKNVTRADRGSYRCIAINGVGDAGVKEFKLSVKYGAVIDREHTATKVARPQSGGSRQRVALMCRAYGNPDVAFQWKDENGTVIRGGSAQSFDSQYVSELGHHENDLFSSTLFVNVAHLRGGFYVTKFTCDVTNSLGFDRTYISVVPMGIPDTPTRLRVSNRTFDALTLSWRPAFDGGKKQTFLLQYRQSSRISTKSAKQTRWHQLVIPSSITSYSILGLESRTSYLVRIQANNTFGTSHPTDYIVVATTDEHIGSPEIAGFSTIFIIVVAASCVCGFLLVVILVTCCIKRTRGAAYTKRSKNSPGQCSHSSRAFASEQGTLLSSCKGSRSASPPSQRSGGSGQSEECGSPRRNQADGGCLRSSSDISRSKKKITDSFTRSSRDSTLNCKNYNNSQTYDSEMKAGFRQLTTSASFQHETRPKFAHRYNVPDGRIESGRPRRANSVSSIDFHHRNLALCAAADGSEYSVPVCHHGASWDTTCDECKMERFERFGMRSSARGTETLNHCAAGKRYTGKQRGYYTMSTRQQPSARMVAMENTLYPIPDAETYVQVTEPRCYRDDCKNANIESLATASYASTASSCIARHHLSQAASRMPMLHDTVTTPTSESFYQNRDIAAMYAVNVQAGIAMQSNNSGGLYVLDLDGSGPQDNTRYARTPSPDDSDPHSRHRVSSRKDCVPDVENSNDATIDSTSMPPLSSRLKASTPNAPCVRNSWISSSSSMSDYQQTQHRNQEQQFYTDSGVEVGMSCKESPVPSKTGSITNHDDVTCASDKSSIMSLSSSTSSTKPLIPNSCSGKAGRTGPSPPLHFRDSPLTTHSELQKNAFLLQCSTGQAMNSQEGVERDILLKPSRGLSSGQNVAFLGVDEDGTLFI